MKNQLIRLWNFVIEYSKGYLLLKLLFICLIFRFLYFYVLFPDMLLYNSDSVTYFIPVDIFSGKIDMYRTPVYPYIIQIVEYFSKEYVVRNIVLFQQILSFLSIIPFFFIANTFVRNRFLTAFFVLCYGCFPSIINHNVNINPECLCIISSTVFLYLISIYIRKPRKILAFLIGFLPLILIMLKPIYLVLLPICFVFFLGKLLVRDERKILYYGFAGLMIAITGVFGYCMMNKKYNGEFALSKISLNNALANVVISSAFLSGDDEELITLVRENRQKGDYMPVYLINKEWIDQYRLSSERFPQDLTPTWDMNYCFNALGLVNYPVDRINNFVKKGQHSKAYVIYMVKRIVKIFLLYKILSIALFIELFLFVFAFVRYKKIVWTLSFSIFFVFGQYFTIALGSIDDWGRLIIPSVPFIMLILATFTELLLSSINKNKFIHFFDHSF